MTETPDVTSKEVVSTSKTNTSILPHDEQPKVFITSFEGVTTIASALSSILGLSALLTLAGFFVISSYTVHYGKIVFFSVQISTYIGGGFWGLLTTITLTALIYGYEKILSYLKYKWLRNLIRFPVFIIACIGLTILITFALQGSLTNILNVGVFVLISLSIIYLTVGNINDSISTSKQHFLLTGLKYISFFMVVPVMLIIPVIFGSTVYPLISRSMGGGRPAPVVIEMSADGANTQKRLANPTCLLLELTSGYLIYNPTNRTTSILSYNYVVSVTAVNENTLPPNYCLPVLP